MQTLKCRFSLSLSLSLRATATLEAERAAFEAEKKAHYELYEKQQQVCSERERVYLQSVVHVAPRALSMA